MNHSQPVQATRLTSYDEFFPNEGPEPAPGSYFVHDGKFWYICPCGCESKGGLPIRCAEYQSRPSWEFDGNEECPTLAPSIRQINGCKFHGHLVKGVWTFCNDSGK